MTITRSTPVADLPQLLRVDEAASWLGCSTGLLYESIKRGTIKHVALGRLVRIPRSALAQMVGEETAVGDGE